MCRKSDGLWLECCSEISKQYPHIQYNEQLADSLLTGLMLDHSQYDILLCSNLYGDLISDLLAGMIGSLGLSGASQIGVEYALFEPTHGSAPDIANKNIVNPVSMLMSVSMLLEHIGEIQASKKLNQAIKIVVEQGNNVTKDLGGNATTKQMTNAIKDQLNKLINQ